MKYYKNSLNQVFAYCNDGSQDDFISTDLIAITAQEASKLIEPTVEDIQHQNQLIKKSLINDANEKISILQDIIDLDLQESNEEEQLKQWKKYRILITRVDAHQTDIFWPEKPE